jgi:hypothetical protein
MQKVVVNFSQVSESSRMRYGIIQNYFRLFNHCQIFLIKEPLQYLELYDIRAIGLRRSRLSAIENIADTTRTSAYTRSLAISPTLNYPI